MLAHLAAGYAGKKFAPKVSLGTLLIAGTFLDILWSPLLLLGIEHARIVPGITVCCPLDLFDYPFSHSLLFTLFWAFLFRTFYQWRHKKDAQGGWVLFACVLSHWLFDLISHRPDLPLLPFTGPTVGLSLWNFPLATLTAELGLFIAGVVIYAHATKPKDLAGRISLLVLVFLQAFAYLTSAGAPLPPNIMAVAIMTQMQWIYLLLAYFVDAHRSPLTPR